MNPAPKTEQPTGTVLYVLKRYPRLSETFVVREILGLEALGTTVAVDALSTPEPGPVHPEVSQVRARVRHLARRPRLRDASTARAHLQVALRHPMRWMTEVSRARRTNSWRRFLHAGMVADRARRIGATNLHAHFATAAAEVATTASLLCGLPCTVTAHAKDVFHDDNADLVRRRLAGAAAVVTVSQFNVAHLGGLLGPKPVHHVANGVPLAAPVGPTAGGPVLCVARLVPKKGIDLLIDAVAKLAPSRPEIRLEIVGDGPLRRAFEATVLELGLEDHVTFLGSRSSDDVDAAYRRCSMLVLPCRVDADGDRDGLPTVLVEALARAVPVISTDVVGIPELVRDGVTGLLTPPEDAGAIASAIATLLDDHALAVRLGEAGRRLVARDYDPERSARALAAVFAEVAS
jgi:colanic acid/amylovoran biosynthesis glycosyltransferase